MFILLLGFLLHSPTLLQLHLIATHRPGCHPVTHTYIHTYLTRSRARGGQVAATCRIDSSAYNKFGDDPIYPAAAASISGEREGRVDDVRAGKERATKQEGDRTK
eukprot:GHVU01154225.1.p6 GENE.GHVU01154225.1~~GHVU01154225.1.p6  ORF type:complete len:105 (+),score=13.67 GHVU01154225.1:1729-2043(+)